MHHDAHQGFFGEPHGGVDFLRRGLAVPFLGFVFLLLMALLAAPARVVLDRLLLQVIERFADGGDHVSGLRQSDQRAIARADGDFGFVAVFLDRQDHLGFKFVAQDLADFCQAGFDFFADARGDFVVPAGVFHVHERPLLSCTAVGHCAPARRRRYSYFFTRR